MRIAKTRNGQIVGQRPNWRSPVTESVEFKTGIITSEDRTEQRFSSRVVPRLRYDFAADTAGDQQRRMMTDFRTFPVNGIWLFPLYWRYVRLTSDEASTSTALNHDGGTPWWAAIGMEVIAETEDAYHTFTISGVADGVLALSDATGVALPARTRIYPAMPVRYDRSGKIDYRIADVGSSSISLLVDPGGHPDWATPEPVQLWSHVGHEILRQPPNWRNNVTREFEAFRDLIDFERGAVSERQLYDNDILRQKFTFTGMSREKADSLTQFFMRQEGRRLPFWVPSYTRDMEVAFEAPQASSALTVHMEDIGTALDADPMFTTIVVIYPDGCMQFNTVTDISVTGGYTVLTLERPWSRAVPLGARVCWALLCRFSTDTLEIGWETDSVAETAVGVEVLGSAYLSIPDGPPSRPVEQLYNHGATWNDPVNFPYTEWDLGGEGMSLESIDRNKGTASCSCDGFFDSNGTQYGTARVSIFFFDAAGVEIPVAYPTSYEDTFFRPDGADTYPFSATITAAIPPNTRYVRCRAGVNHSYTEFTGVCSVVSYPWGDLYSLEDLKCP